MNQENSGLIRLIIGLVVGVVLGLAIGLAFGYLILPVEWTNAQPQDLREDYGAYYWELVTESYKEHGDLELVKRQLGPWDDQQRLDAALQRAFTESAPEDQLVIDTLAKKITGSEVEMPTAVPSEETPAPSETPAAEPAEEGGGPSFLTIVGIFLLILVFVIAVIFLIIRMRKGKTPEEPVVEEVPDWVATMHPEEAAPQTPPLGHFVTSYALGNDVYDESFSIETDAGEFLGECGVGISETIGVGDPDKVTAFEIWLFDKNDIRTITKVLMSEHAYNDQELRARLATKGEAILAQPNQPVTLETATLRVDAMVTEAIYGTGPLPANSFFDRLTLELVSYAKEGEIDNSPGELNL